MFPTLSRLYKRSPEDYRIFLERGIHYMLASGLPAAIGLFMLARPILELVYGSGFEQAQSLAQLISLSLPFIFIGSTLGNAISASDRQKTRVMVMTAGVVVHLSLSLWLIPITGANGAALAIFLAAVTRFILFLIVVMRTTGVPYRLSRSLPVLVAALTMTGVLQISGALPVLLRIGAAGAVYLLVLMILDTLLREDIRHVFSRAAAR